MMLSPITYLNASKGLDDPHNEQDFVNGKYNFTTKTKMAVTEGDQPGAGGDHGRQNNNNINANNTVM